MYSRLVFHFGNHRIPTFALHQRHDSLLVIRSNHRITFPVTHLLSILNMRRALAQRTSIGYLPSAIMPTGVTLSLLLLTTQVLPQLAALGFVCVHMKIKRFIAHRQLTRDLLWAPLKTQQHISLALGPSVNLLRIATTLRTNQGKLAGLLGTIATQTFIATKLSADRGFVAPNLSSNLRDALVGFDEAVNLIYFDLAKRCL